MKKDVKQAASFEHPAMFACIMRRSGVKSALECHGFVCNSKEDALRIASNLYKALMETMREQREKDVDAVKQPQRPPRGRRRNQDGQRRKGADSAVSAGARRQHQQRAQSDVRRSTSERRPDEEKNKDLLKKHMGDIYTKVAMPRSMSFMNVGAGYNLQELFKELREREGIESVDDILRHVIKPDGMSYNKISPVYRELLLKLALSLSADEMFIRSKNIIMEEKVKRANVNGTSTVANNPANVKTASSSSLGFNRILQFIGVSKKPAANIKAEDGKVSKADIGNPIPLGEEARKELAKHWSKVSPVAGFGFKMPLAELSRLQQTKTRGDGEDKANNNDGNVVVGNDSGAKNVSSTAPRSGVAAALARRRAASVVGPSGNDECYGSCSECGYQSVCDTNCSCSAFAATTAAEEEEDLLLEREGSARRQPSPPAPSSSSSAAKKRGNK